MMYDGLKWNEIWSDDQDQNQRETKLAAYLQFIYWLFFVQS